VPELPEVEVTRLSFASRIEGARVESAWMGKPLRWPLGVPEASLAGQGVRAVRRRGKYLLIDLDAGVLLVHLGMSGSLAFGPSAQLRSRGVHDHFELQTTRGLLRLHDPRRFGAVVWAPSESQGMALKLLSSLGPEPLVPDFDVKAFHARLKRRRVPIKIALLAGDAVVGVGNIYASEVLFRVGIRPTRSASRTTRAQAEQLVRAVQEVLAAAVKAGGSTLRDFESATGDDGHFQLQAMVYGREAEPCRVCTTPIRRIVQGQRSTYYCPQCQK
jgi:formamidopyrimidine-DNA glycosylase